MRSFFSFPHTIKDLVKPLIEIPLTQTVQQKDHLILYVGIVDRLKTKFFKWSYLPNFRNIKLLIATVLTVDGEVVNTVRFS